MTDLARRMLRRARTSLALVGYFLTPVDAEYPRYVSCANLYGPRTGVCLTRAATELVHALGRGEQPPSAPVACDE